MRTRSARRGLAAVVAGATLALGTVVVGAPAAHAAAPIGVATWQELQAAINLSGPGNPVSVALTADIGHRDGPWVEGLVLPEGADVTLDLNAHELGVVGADSHAGIQTSGAALTIEATGGGKLTAIGRPGFGSGGAGIGPSVGTDRSGAVTINGGDVWAYATEVQPGIVGDAVTITGGTVVASSRGSHGIAAGRTGVAGQVKITGGSVTATAGEEGDGSGIGAATPGVPTFVTVTGGVVTASGSPGHPGMGGAPAVSVSLQAGTISATGGAGSPAIGGSSDVPSGSDTYIGPAATVVATSGVGANVVVGDNVALPDPASLTNHGDLTLVGRQTVFPTGSIRPTIGNSGVITLKGDLVGTGEIYNSATIIEDGGLVSPDTPVTVHHYRVSYDLNGQPGTPPAAQRVFAPSYDAGHVTLPPPPAGFEWQAPGGQPVTAATDLPALFGAPRHSNLDSGATLVTLHLARTNQQPAPATLSLSGLTRTYDGSPQPVTATTAPAGIDGVAVTYDGSPTAPTDAGSYQVVATLDNPAYAADPVTGTLVIKPKEVTGSFAAADKVWDGSTAATITARNLSGLVTGDDAALTGGTASFDSAAVGTAKTVTGSGFSLAGADAVNYVLVPVQPWTTTASITPVPPSGEYRPSGFRAPVDMSAPGQRVWNTIKGGRTVALKFEVFDAVTGAEVTDVAVIRSFTTTRVGCATGSADEDPVELVTTGGTSLRYDAASGTFVQNWKTPTISGACYQVTVTLVDGSVIDQAFFEIKR